MPKPTMRQWKPVVGFESCYEVSNFGQVRTTKSRGWYAAGHALAPHDNGSEYMSVTLCLDGHKAVRRYVHRIVAEAFLGPCPNGYEVHHRNHKRGDNRLCNLEYITRSENLRHRREHHESLCPGWVKENKSRPGEQNGNAKITPDTVVALRKARNEEGLTYHALAARFHLSKTHVARIVKGESWSLVHEPSR